MGTDTTRSKMKYASIPLGNDTLAPYYRLSPSLQITAMELAIPYMNAVVRVNCPICRANDAGGYNEDNEKCVQCWYKHLAKMAEGVAEGARRSSKRD